VCDAALRTAPRGAYLHLPPPLLRHWVGMLKAMINKLLPILPYCSFRHHSNLPISYCKLFSLNHPVLSAFDEGPGSQYIQYFCNTCCFTLVTFRKLIISLSKYIQFDLNNWWITYNSNLANFMNFYFMTHKSNGITQLFQMTKK